MTIDNISRDIGFHYFRLITLSHLQLAIPNCYTLKQWSEKCQSYPWLKANAQGCLLCQVCQDVKRVTPSAARNSRIREEWAYLVRSHTATRRLSRWHVLEKRFLGMLILMLTKMQSAV